MSNSPTEQKLRESHLSNAPGQETRRLSPRARIIVTAAILTVVYVGAYSAMRDRRERNSHLEISFGGYKNRVLDVLFSPLSETECLIQRAQRRDAKAVLDSALAEAR